MRNCFFILPKLEKLYFNECLRFLSSKIDICSKKIIISASDFRRLSFDICSKELSTMRNRFFIVPKPEKLNFNEFPRF